ncbi:hypothetical protein [Actinacidiphila acididurans]|uniref:Lipoprotein n=1 Tax=Actinacidiphila acididurans TaxID=2784346 RepID=A0ABS2TYL0_9ACTN|nr:hypothetical protein [Actinacidiphila acididurans]MBM9508428.1 hypothetical protein [Actinacidiphila acididurans]
MAVAGVVAAAALGAAALGTVVLAGCAGRVEGSTAVPGTPQDAAFVSTLSGAADALVAAGTSRVATSMRMASGGTWLTITGTGGFDYAAGRGRLTVTLPRDAAGVQEHKPITELLTPGVLYMKDRGEGVPAGKWVRVDTTRLPDLNVVTGGATEPLAAAELLRGAQDVKFVAQETLPDGTRVRHFRGTADIVRAAAAAPAPARAALDAAARGFAVTRVPFDAWLDPSGRLRELSQTFTFSAAGTRRGAGRNATVVSTIRYGHFGAPVSVIMPRPADIWSGKIVSAPAG